MALEGELEPFWVHPSNPCSGTTDAINMVISVQDEALQKLWEQEYGHPSKSDYKLLNDIWNSKILVFLIKIYFKLKKK